MASSLLSLSRAAGDLASLILKSPSGTPRELGSCREALKWTMKCNVQVLLGQGEEAPGLPDSDVLPYNYSEESFVKKMHEVLALRKENSKEFASIGPSLGAIHFRGAWLEDGRETVACSPVHELDKIIDKDKLHKRFHERLLSIYQRIYGRPLTFNDRLFPKVAGGGIEVWALRFGSRGEATNLLSEKELCGGAVINLINISQSLLESLVMYGGVDLREKIYNRLFFDCLTCHEEREISDAILNLRREGTLSKLDEVIERAWVRVLSHDGSFEQWKTLLQSLDFFSEFWGLDANRGQVDEAYWGGWTPEARLALRSALVFFQGISLYEIVARAGFATLIASKDKLKQKMSHAAFTVGANTWSKVERCIERIVDEAGEALDALIPEIDWDTDVTDDYNFNLVFRRKDEESVLAAIEKEHLNASEEALASAFLLGRSLCDLIHEQRSLEFQIIVAGAESLGFFKELYVLTKEESDLFKKQSPERQALLLRAHHSHFQMPQVALFLEANRRIHPRIISVPQVSIRDRSFSLIREELEPTMHEASMQLSASIPGAIVMRTGSGAMQGGKGRVLVYWDGRVKLMWSGPRAMWSWAEDEDSWVQKDALRRLLEAANNSGRGALKDREVQILAGSLLWVADQPGLGCMLVVMFKGGLLNDCKIMLNPNRWRWVEAIRPAAYDQSLIRNILIQDGGVALELPTGKLEGQVQLIPMDKRESRIVDVGKERKDNPETWIYGTRHTSALGLSKVFDGKCLAVTVSADGPISVFWKGNSIMPDAINTHFGSNKKVAPEVDA